MHETFQWSLYSNLLKRFSGLYMGTNTYVSEYMFGPTRAVCVMRTATRRRRKAYSRWQYRSLDLRGLHHLYLRWMRFLSKRLKRSG
jgi:hypothetical protein